MEHSKEYLDWLARQFDEQLTEKDKSFLVLMGITLPEDEVKLAGKQN